MDETVIVIMVRDRQTGFLEKELVSCVVEKHEDLLLNAFVSENTDGMLVVLKLTCSAEVSDSEFDAVYDYYDHSVYDGLGVICEEVEDCFNPTWEFRFMYDEESIEEKINKLLEIHAKEINDVFEAVRSGGTTDY